MKYKNCEGLKISICRQCKFINSKWTNSKYGYDMWSKCIRNDKTIHDKDEIPSWCPLEDYKEEAKT